MRQEPFFSFQTVLQANTVKSYWGEHNNTEEFNRIKGLKVEDWK